MSDGEQAPLKSNWMTSALGDINPVSVVSLVVAATVLWQQVSNLKEDFADLKSNNDAILTQVTSISAKFERMDYQFEITESKLSRLREDAAKDLERANRLSDREINRIVARLEKIETLLEQKGSVNAH